MSEENKAITRRFIEEVWNQGNLDAVDEFVTSDYVLHVLGDEVRGPENFKQFISGYRSAFPDIKFTVEDQIAEGDKVVDRWTARGTHKGELLGIPPTGKQVMTTGIDIGRIVNGKMVERWGQSDMLGMLQQLGIVPPPGEGGS